MQLRKKIVDMKKKKIKQHPIVSLSEYRTAAQEVQEKLVVIVDQEEHSRQSVKRMLESKGFLVTIAQDGIELSQILESQKVDLILMEVHLPWVSGLELCEMLKNNKKFYHVPIVCLSKEISDQDKQKALSSGANAYLERPWDFEQLFQTIQVHLTPSTSH